MLTKEISEVEKGCNDFIEEDNFEDEEDLFDHDIYCGMNRIKDNKLMLCPICQAKLSTLKSAQAKFDKFVKDLKAEVRRLNFGYDYDEERIIECIDELSSKQEEKE
jgi:hypothetical protein